MQNEGVQMKAAEGTHACEGAVTLLQAHCHNNLNQGNGRRNEEEESRLRNNMKKNGNDFLLTEGEGAGEV